MNDLSQTFLEQADAAPATSWLPPEAPLSMPRQQLEGAGAQPILTAILRLLHPLRRA